ncbi:uncharacterized protein LOC129808888 [Phlebotomus papatasi]|uniref:uncharacterized protein LOC129808888 n=1 Tax=Phlebotomus papatasi TaxID=29031 RepID=UPI002483DA78|nr:uncharacterized protein LOC129808888 [Phlebotomus papatasi]
MATIATLHRQRGAYKGKLTKLEGLISQKFDHSSQELLVYEKELQTLSEKFDSVQQQVYSAPALSDEGFSAEQEEESQFSDRILALQIKLKKLLSEIEAQDDAQSTTSHDNINSESMQSLTRMWEEQLKLNSKLMESMNGSASGSTKLPQLSVPKFSGNYTEWISFREMFTSAVHNKSSLSDAEKFQYLKGYLCGEAESVVHHLAMTGENYHVAWELIQDEYEKKQNITTEYLRTFFEQPNIADANPKVLRSLYITSNKVIQALDTIGCTERDIWLIYIILNKLDSETKTLWSREITASEVPTWQQFMKFLKKRCDSLGMVCSGDASAVKKSKDFKPAKADGKSEAKPTQRVSCAVTTDKKCVICSRGSHRIIQCYKFLNSSPSNQLELVRAHKICINCLRHSHPIESCESSNCRRCGLRHNTLLHEAITAGTSSGNTSVSPQVRSQSIEDTAASPQATSGTSAVPQSTQTQKPSQLSAPATLVSHPAVAQHSLLPTISLFIIDSDGRRQRCRALLDSCSQVNFITKRFAEKIHLRTYVKPNFTIAGIGNTCTDIPHATQATIASRDFSFTAKCEFLILDKIVNNQPTAKVSANWTLPQGINFADPQFAYPSSIDMLLGVDIFAKVILPGKIEGSPMLLETVFGYVVAGSFTSTQTSGDANCFCVVDTCEQSDSLQHQLEKFWKIEELEATKPILSKEESNCEAHYKQNTHRDERGRYVVSLPTRDNLHLLGDSHDIARKRFLCIERKLRKNPELREKYIKFMTEYEQLGHMRLMPPDYSSTKPAVYLPHHPVVKESSSSTPVRVVFDASAKTTTGVALNDVLMVGPRTQEDIFNILIRFRQYNVVIKADIRKMFRQVLVQEEDQNLQRILWRNDPYKPIQTFLLSTVTYGTASATYLSTRTIQQLAVDEGNQYPLAQKAAVTDFYVDDFLSGQATLESAKELRHKMSELMEKGGFHLTKWMSSDSAALDGVPEEECEVQSADLPGADDSIKALGVRWSPSQDVFTFTTSPCSEIITKRVILSEISRVFDPLGFLAPVVITAKILMQSLWQLKVDWDTDLSGEEEIVQRWLIYRQSIMDVTHIHVPRHVTSHQEPTEYHILLFCDASEKAYAACAYIMTVNKNQETSCRLLCSKTRVAPLKQVTLPRLELCAAVLAVKLLQSIKGALTVKIMSVKAYSDSKIVLYWLAKEPQKWKTFVANRVSEIQSEIPRHLWNHVPSELNPADVASRGISPSELARHTLWWYGPDISALDNSLTDDISDSEELENTPITCTVSFETSFWKVIEDFSSHSKMIRLLSYWRRFIFNARAKITHTSGQSGPLTASELRATNTHIIFHIQAQAFRQEIQALSSKKPLPRQSRILDLNPFIDESGLIRVGGRIQKSNLPVSQKHQVLLPDKHRFTHLIAERVHLETCHGGPQMILSTMRQQYWPLRGLDIAKKVAHKCVQCFRCNPRSAHQIMGNLPADRVQFSRPFSKVGVDFCGPFHVKLPIRRGTTVKMYVAVFICFVSKAIHLELVTELSAEAFIAALKRFTARRGKPSDIFCDNATNFVGASGQLTEIHRFLTEKSLKEKIIKYSAQDSTTFHFIPPRSPHFGGLWESAVKMFKRHFYRVTGNVKLTQENFLTVLAEVEMCLNSRPLTSQSSDPSDMDVLTPGHFIIGGPMNSLPSHDVTNIPPNRLNQWRINDQLVQHFWRRWSREVLLNMQKRRKWKTAQPNVQPGDLVLLIEENMPPLAWILGRITDVHPGEDQKIRVVTVRTKNGTYKRAVTRIAPLPMPEETEQEVLKQPLHPGEYGTSQSDR